MNKKQILRITLSVLVVGATFTTAGYIFKYSICPKIKVLSYDKEKGIVKIKWGGKEYAFDKSVSAVHLNWTAKLEDDKVNIYNKKNIVIKSYPIIIS